jgi:hypothetical protein
MEGHDSSQAESNIQVQYDALTNHKTRIKLFYAT